MGQRGRNGSKRQIRAVNNGGARGVRGAEMDQNAKFVLNNGGANWVLNNGGARGRNGSKRQTRAEQWGGQIGQMGQNAEFVLNNGGLNAKFKFNI